MELLYQHCYISGVVRGIWSINEVTLRWAQLVLRKVTVFGWVYHLGV